MHETVIPETPTQPVNALDPSTNQWLTIRATAVRSKQTDPVIARLDKYFAEAQLKAEVSSILRDPTTQLYLIIDYAKKYNLKHDFTDQDVDVKLDNVNYVWQETWSLLLNRGIIINPPRVAVCLEDYVSPNSGFHKAGYLIQPSPHFTGRAFDISGGNDMDISNELAVVNKALAADPNIGISSLTIERTNNCVHCQTI
jgi:hypothetical protein